MYNPVATLPRSTFLKKKQVFILSFDFFFVKNVSKRPKFCLEEKNFRMLFHHGTLKSTLSDDCLFFFSPLNLSDKIIKMEEKKIDDDKKKMVEQKKVREKLFLYNQIFS